MNAKQIWKMYNEMTRKYEAIDINEAELLEGQTVVLMFWCESDRRFVTVPGASLYKVNGEGDMVLSND